jgi:predicted HicB family RNase H-like nuclease
MKGIYIQIDDQLHASLKLAALTKKMTLKELVTNQLKKIK